MENISPNKTRKPDRETVKRGESSGNKAVLFQKLPWTFAESGEAPNPCTNAIRKGFPSSSAGTPAPPKKLTIEILKKCFNECVYCSAYVSKEDAKRILNEKKVRLIIDQFADLGGQELNISGGEPLLHPNCFDIASYAKAKGLEVNLFTCGILSDKISENGNIVEAIDKISNAGFDSIEMTLHAPYSTMHDEITCRKGSFINTYSFMKLLSSRAKNLEINFIPMQINAEELEELVDFVVGLGISRLNILRFIPQGKGRTNKEWLTLTKDQVARLMSVVLEMSARNDIKINIGHPGDFTFLIEKSRNPKLCTAGKEQCMVKINGDVIPCPAFSDLKEWVAGNAFRRKLRTIWEESPVFMKLREFNYKCMQGNCRVCVHLPICQGRCPAQRIRENRGLYKGPDPGCPKDYVQHSEA